MKDTGGYLKGRDDPVKKELWLKIGDLQCTIDSRNTGKEG